MNKHQPTSVKYDTVAENYLTKRKLEKKAGWVLLFGLGVGAVISGDYFGWNFGLLSGGFWGLAIATLLMAVMYLTMMYTLAELSTALPHAGGPYSFARQALGPWGGYLCGLAVTIEYVITPAVIVVGLGGYIHTLIPQVHLYIWWAVSYIVFVFINVRGVELTMRVSLGVTIIATLILIIFYVSAIVSGAFSWSNLFSVQADAGQSATWLPKGWYGVFATLPFAIWFYLAIEELPLAAEETENVSRDMPRAMLFGIFTLLILSVLTLVLNSGVGGGAISMGHSAAPLAEGFQAIFGFGTTSVIFIVIALTGLIASFHSIIYAYGRQIFALSRAGYFPRVWSLTHHKYKTPHVALWGGALFGFVCAILIDQFSETVGAALLNMAVFGGVISYVLMMFSYLKIKNLEIKRPYKSPGGKIYAVIALVLAFIALFACFSIPEYRPGVWGVAVWYVLGILYFAVVSRKKLVAAAPEEEFALIEKAQSEIKRNKNVP
jgi:ethanolamine permease